MPRNRVIGIESPTGTGKTAVMMSYIQSLMQNPKFQGHGRYDICITTNTNNLVFQLERTALDMGLDPIVFIGRSMTECRKRYDDKKEKYPERSFLQYSSHRPRIRDCKDCCVECWYDKILNVLRSKADKPRLIITNHSMYMILYRIWGYRPNMCFIDEAHTFLSFYQNMENVELDKREIKEIDEILEANGDRMLVDVFRNSIKNGLSIHPNFMMRINKFLERELQASKETRNKYNIFKLNEMTRKLTLFSQSKNSISEFLDNSDDKITLVRFFDRFEIGQENIKYCLLSATMDEYTIKLFDFMNIHEDLYREKAKLTDYRNSECQIWNCRIENDEVSTSFEFLEEMNERGMKNGLMLSTTNKLVDAFMSHGEICGYKILNRINDYLSYDGKKILVGSRALFQGVDIPDLDFVFLNCIPFQRYDLRFRKNCIYINKQSNNGRKMDAWMDYTIPQLKNDLTQATGRLWRKPDSKGVIAIFDERLQSRFQNLAAHIERERPGIKMVYKERSK